MKALFLALVMAVSVPSGVGGSGIELRGGIAPLERTGHPAPYPFAAAAAAAPSKVTGYSDHCRQRMLERRVSTNDVEFTVLLYNVTATYNHRADTWVYENRGSGLTVVLNDAGRCVTVY